MTLADLVCGNWTWRQFLSEVVPIFCAFIAAFFAGRESGWHRGWHDHIRLTAGK